MGLPGYPVQNSPSGNYSWGGGFRQGGNSIWYYVNGMPQKDTLDRAAYTCMLVSYRRHSSQFQFSLSGVTLVYLSQCSAYSSMVYIQYARCTEYIFYCKRAILFLSSSKILTPHPPLSPASLASPRKKGGGYTVHTRRAERGMGGQYFGRREK